MPSFFYRLGGGSGGVGGGVIIPPLFRICLQVKIYTLTVYISNQMTLLVQYTISNP